MEPSGYILTGLQRYRKKAHAPVILGHVWHNHLKGEAAGFEELNLRANSHANYEHFNVWPITRSALNRVDKATAPFVYLDKFAICQRKDRNSAAITR